MFRPKATTLICAQVLGAAIFFIARPYAGVQGDGVLYFGQVLQKYLFDFLAQDTFFVGGSQDDFSLYARLLAPLYQISGPAIANQAILLAALFGYVFATTQLLKSFSLSPPWGLLSLAVSSALYGGLRKFGIAENFLTARSLAEPLIIASLIPLVRGSWTQAIGLQLSAAAFHPLMALPACAVTWMLALQRDKRWLLLPAAFALTGALLSLWVGRIAGRYDAFWWAQVSGSNVQVVLSNWTGADWMTAAADASVLVAALCSSLLSDGGKRLVRAVLIATVLLLAIAGLGTDLLQSVLITQLQTWRVLWLTHLLATLLAPYLIWGAWRQKGLWRISASLLTLTLISNHAGTGYALPLWLGWICISLAAQRNVRISPSLVTFVVALCALMLVALSGLRLQLELERLYWRPTEWPALDVLSHIITTPLLTFGVAAGLARWWPRDGQWPRWLAAGLSIACLVLALWHWDRRDELARAIETPPHPTPFADKIPTDATVYWPEQLAGTWGLLHRVSHYNRQQGAGMLFNRATAELIVSRRAAYAGIKEDFDSCEMGSALGGTPATLATCAIPSTARLRELCGGAVHPDYMVFEQPLDIRPLSTWTSGHIALHLYACTQFGAIPTGTS